MSLAGTAPGRALLGPGRRPGTLPWLIGATAFLATLAFAAALGLAGAARTLATAGTGRYTIEVIDADPARRDATAARLLADVRRVPGVAAAVPVPPAEIARLAAPVLGTADAVPLPALIDVTLAPGAADAPLAALVRRAPRADLVATAAGLAPLAALVTTLRRLALAVALLAAAVTLLVAVLAARATLAAHAATLATLHALGATDADLAALVQRRTGRDALLSGAAGLAVAALAIWRVAARLAALEALAPGGTVPGVRWLLLALVPLGLAAAATLAARLAVLRALARQP